MKVSQRFSSDTNTSVTDHQSFVVPHSPPIQNPIDQKYTRSYCEAIAQKITLVNKVPNECKDFSSVMAIIRRREETQSNHARAFEGMTPGEAQAAMAAREKGHLNPMQIQRRMTNRNSRRVW